MRCENIVRHQPVKSCSCGLNRCTWCGLKIGTDYKVHAGHSCPYNRDLWNWEWLLNSSQGDTQ